jgi:branched-chain amino acid transport system ATP-binding protein
VLEIKDIHTYYGKSYVLQGISLEVREREIVGILGRNGVGKTTTLRSIMGLTLPKSGEIYFMGKAIHNLNPHLIPRLGIGYVPQGRRIFPRLSVLENLKTPVIDARMEKNFLNEVFDYFPILSERAKQAAGTLSGGEQQMLSIGRAMMFQPKLMILDEPTEGLMPLIVTVTKQSILKMNREKGVSILLVEQNIETALDVCHQLYLIEKGSVIYKERVSNIDKDNLLQLLGL